MLIDSCRRSGCGFPSARRNRRPRQRPLRQAEGLEARTLLSLVSVTFGGAGFHPITSDADPSFPTYTSQQWLSGESPHQWPVLYGAGSVPTVSATWTNFLSASGTDSILAKATTSNGLLIAPKPVTVVGNQLVMPSAAFTGGTVGTTAEFLSDFVIHWQLSSDGGRTWVNAGASDNPLYVSAAANPLADPLTDDFFLTVVDSEINETQRLAAGATSSIVTNTWNLFAGAAVRQFSPEEPFSDGTEHGEALTYYGTPASTSDPTGQQLLWDSYTHTSTVWDLLSTGDGQCTSWTELFLDMLLISDIVAPKDFVTVTPAQSAGFLVNNWSFVGTGTSGIPS